jgi:hypothetical protein
MSRRMKKRPQNQNRKRLMNQFYSLLQISFLMILIPQAIFSFADKVHQNLSEDAILYMEHEGSNQQRWVVDYLKAKAGSRTQAWGECVDPDGPDSGTSPFGYEYSNTFCGIVGISRAGGFMPDYFRDAFWDDITDFKWHVTQYIDAIPQNNFSSWYHFLNLLQTNDPSEGGHTIVANNHNDYDGYSYNGSYGMPALGVDYGLAVFMNNAKMTIDLPACTLCTQDGGKWTYVAGTNPASDYKQNGATTPLGNPSSDGRKLGEDDGTNYNCFSDTMWPNDCPDKGTQVGGTYQIPNTNPGDDNNFTSDQDWVIYEPADNVSVFFYNEWFLEGGVSKNSSLQTWAVVNRYYTLPAAHIIYLAIPMHFAGDLNQQSHVWSTIGYNHSNYEGKIEETSWYGGRTAGASAWNNFENFSEVKSHQNMRIKRYNQPLDDILTEAAFYTYHIRIRDKYDTLLNDSVIEYENAGRWAVNNSIAVIANMFEKGVIDLRKCRNSSACNNE